MYYHCVLTMGTAEHYFWNYSFDEAIREIVIPYINKQMTPVNFKSKRAILNMSSASYLQVFKTSEVWHLEKRDAAILEKRMTSDDPTFPECTQELIDTAMAGRHYTETKSTLQNQFAVTEKQVFVIMKFDDSVLDSAYKGVIQPIVKKHKYKPIRIDDIQDSGKITDQIIEEISKSEIVIADLTGERPNCYYEAGFAHAVGKQMIFTIRRNTPIHFDLYSYRFIEWDTEHELREGLDSRFKSIKKRSLSL